MNFLISYSEIAAALVLILAITVRWFLLPADRKRTKWLFIVTALIIPTEVVAGVIVIELSRLRPLKYDEFVYLIDGVFGHPSFVLGRLVEHHKSLAVVVNLTYDWLPIVIVAVFAVYLWFRTEAESLRVLWAFALNLFAAVPLYLLFPVCGPRFAFLHFPDRAPLIVTPHLLKLAAPPNGVPSVHTSSALLIFWFLLPWRWGRYAGTVFLVLTVLATLGSGQHYCFDLLVAVPYAAAVYWVAYGHVGISFNLPARVSVTP